jgi:hypothetical protein
MSLKIRVEGTEPAKYVTSSGKKFESTMMVDAGNRVDVYQRVGTVSGKPVYRKVGSEPKAPDA